MTNSEATSPSIVNFDYFDDMRLNIPMSILRGVYSPLNRIGIGAVSQRVRRSLDRELGAN